MLFWRVPVGTSERILVKMANPVKGKVVNLDTSTLMGRVQCAFGGLSIAEIAKEIDINYHTLRNYLRKQRDIPSDVLAQIGNSTNYSVNWLLTGIGAKRVANAPPFNAYEAGLSVEEEIADIPEGERSTQLSQEIKSEIRNQVRLLTGKGTGRTVEATNAEIIENFELDELRAIRELSVKGGVSISTVIAELAKEDLISRGLVRTPLELPIESISSYPNESDQYRCVVRGEIQDENALFIYPDVQTVQIPKHFNPQDNKDEFIHPNFFHAYRITTNELTEEGLHKADLVVCLSARYAAPLKGGDPVVIPIDQGSKVYIKRFYHDVLNPNTFVFRPIKEKRPIMRLSGIRYGDLDLILGIVTP